MRVLLLLALVGAAIAAVPQMGKRMPERIVGGSPVDVHEYPYMSNMQYHFWGIQWVQFCGGSLITSRTIVSAAHCYYGDRPSQWRVRLGTSLASSGGSVHQVSHLILHERYDDRTIDNDVAIVRLSTPAILNGHTIAVLSIASPQTHLPDHTKIHIAGWGSLSSGGSSPEQLQHVVVDIINHELCRQRYAADPRYPPVTIRMICAGILDKGGKDACQGDSGGPMVYKYHSIDGLQDILCGVVSWGAGCADSHFPGIGASVAHFSNWIVEHGAA